MARRAPCHPLDPLSVNEVHRARCCCKNYAIQSRSAPLRFNVISVKEPRKADLLLFEANAHTTLPRRLFCVVQVPPRFSFIEVLVELDPKNASGDRVLSWVEMDPEQLGAQAMMTPDDCLEAEAIAIAHPEVVSLLQQRGVHNISQVLCDPWAIHNSPWKGRMMQVFLYLRTCEQDNEYAHPMDLCPIIDLNTGEVVHIDKYEQPPEIPLTNYNYNHKLQTKPWRQGLKPLLIIQPQGPSFQVNGHHVSWQNWSFRVGFNGREGLVLHNIGYEDNGAVRPIVHRASIVEMCVPYGDPKVPYSRKCAFDAGDYGLGFSANSLELGCDCLGHIHYFDGVVNDSKGNPVLIKKAVCMHEEDAGLLWKHVDYRNGFTESRRSRRLVISFIMTAINYEYCFYWYLYQDGSIGHEVKLTGILSTSLLSPGEETPQYGTLVAPGVNAAVHQHLFCARLDMAVDDQNGGRDLVISEMDVVPVPTGPDNPDGNAFTFTDTDLTTIHQAMRLADPQKVRIWRVKNPSQKHPSTCDARSYGLFPAPGPCLMAQPDSVVAKRGFFTSKHLIVTPHDDDQMFPAGYYAVQSEADQGLAVWTKQDQSLLGRDPVIWYTFGLTHVPRPEDFPVMPVDQIGFTLKPLGFFDVNPAIDLPPAKCTASQECTACTPKAKL